MPPLSPVLCPPRAQPGALQGFFGSASRVPKAFSLPALAVWLYTLAPASRSMARAASAAWRGV